MPLESFYERWFFGARVKQSSNVYWVKNLGGFRTHFFFRFKGPLAKMFAFVTVWNF